MTSFVSYLLNMLCLWSAEFSTLPFLSVPVRATKTLMSQSPEPLHLDASLKQDLTASEGPEGRPWKSYELA